MTDRGMLESEAIKNGNGHVFGLLRDSLPPKYLCENCRLWISEMSNDQVKKCNKSKN